MDYEKLIRYSLKPSRFLHSVGVRDTAVMLARRFGADEKKAEIAGILHDCAKCINPEEGYKMCREWKIELDEVSLVNYDIVHQYLGAEMAKRNFKIDDEEILNAVRFHTTGRANMSRLDKIIYISDMIEPNRKSYDGIETIRELCRTDLDAAVLYGLENSIKYVMKNSKLIHLDTIRARNSFVSARDKGCGNV